MDLTRATARIRSALGWATADRREEAKGKLEELDHETSDQRGTNAGHADADAVLDEAELHVRHDHGDLAPSAQPDNRPPASPRESG